MRKNRNVVVFIALAAFCAALSFAVAACSGGGIKTNLTGTAEETLIKIGEDIAAAGVKSPPAMPPQDVAADASQNAVGISPQDYEKYVDSVSSQVAVIGTHAHQIAVIKAKDAASAEMIKKIVAGEGGYDSGKWVCVRPEKCVVIDSGAYVLLAASGAEFADAAVAAFEKEAGEVGATETFFESQAVPA